MTDFSSFPVPGTTARTWYFAPGGKLGSQPPAHEAINWYSSNAKALPANDYLGQKTETGGLWGNASQWTWNWKPNPSGTAVSYVSPPLKSNAIVLGAGAVHVWVRSSTKDVDLMATVSEVRPDGHETFIQNGWMRASERKLATSANNLFKQPSTLLEPIPSELASDVRSLPKNKFVEVVIPLYYEGHVYRAGSRIRVTIAAPNGTQPIWSFGHTVPAGTRQGGDRLLEEDALESHPPGGPWSERALGAPAMPEPAQRAVPDLRAADQPRGRGHRKPLEAPQAQGRSAPHGHSLHRLIHRTGAQGSGCLISASR